MTGRQLCHRGFFFRAFRLGMGAPRAKSATARWISRRRQFTSHKRHLLHLRCCAKERGKLESKKEEEREQVEFLFSFSLSLSLVVIIFITAPEAISLCSSRDDGGSFSLPCPVIERPFCSHSYFSFFIGGKKRKSRVFLCQAEWE